MSVAILAFLRQHGRQRRAGFRIALRPQSHRQQAEQRQEPQHGKGAEQHHTMDEGADGRVAHACSSSISMPPKSLGCRNSTGLPCAPMLELAQYP